MLGRRGTPGWGFQNLQGEVWNSGYKQNPGNISKNKPEQLPELLYQHELLRLL